MLDAAKPRDIDDARVIERYRSDYLSWIEAHLLFLGSPTRLMARIGEGTQLSDEAGATGDGALNPAAQDPARGPYRGRSASARRPRCFTGNVASAVA